MIELINNIVKNWKTSLLGLIAFSLVLAFLFGRLTPEQLMTLEGAVLSGGLIAAKDGNVSGR